MTMDDAPAKFLPWVSEAATVRRDDTRTKGRQMKSTHHKLSLMSWTALVAALSLVACSGEDGRDGAAGEMGAPGADGTKGSDGIDGTDGTNGVDGKDGLDGKDGPTKPPRLLDAKITGWSDATRAALNKLITDHGIASAGFDGSKRPVAVFDWDNTVLKNDIGDASFAWLLENDKILQPPNKDWGATSPDLTAAAKTALNAACDGAAAAGAPLPTSTTPACAAEIMNVYYNGKTAAGTAAWTTNNGSGLTSTMNYAYAWVAQLTAGYRPSEVRAFAESAFFEALEAAQGSKKTVGGVEMAAYIRVYDQIRDLAETLSDNGFDVWVVTASPQYVVDAISWEIGVAPSRVIGIRNVITGGKLSYDLQGCGPVADGQNTMMTFDRGKRCWINKVIFKEPVSSQLSTNADVGKRPVLVAGDSDTDIAMLKDATGLKLVLDRNKTQAMCNALANVNQKWFFEPMFIDPKPPKTTAYACSTAKDHDGATIVDENGNVIADQLPK